MPFWMSTYRFRRAGCLGLILSAALVTAPLMADQIGTYAKVREVFSGNTTADGEALRFPVNDPSVHAVVVTLLPGETTVWHRHGTPLFGYVLEGTLTVEYDGLGTREYQAGEGFLEALEVVHQGRNAGTEPMQVLAVFLNGDGAVPTEETAAPEN
ncbi:MAG: cupin domain-containing protein [Pseudomonadota bacterium]